jgi:RNA polymerase sigma-70 factor, ECF subfamily
VDAELVRLALAGDQSACRDLVLAYQGPLYRMLLRMVRDPSLAEDLAQDTFVKAFRALPSFDPERKLSSWLLKIGHNTALDHLRRRAAPTVPLDGGAHEGGGLAMRLADTTAPDPATAARGHQLARDLSAAVTGLDPLYRELLLLRFQEGLSYQEIAELSGLPLGTVKVRLHRGRALLARALEGLGWGRPE